MIHRLRLPTLAFYGICLLMLAGVVVSFISAVSWLNKPFPGFLVYDPPYVGSYSSRDWAGKQAGLSYLDRILEMDGQPIERGQDVLDGIQGKEPGTPIQYRVQSEGETRNVTVPVALFNMKDFILVFSINFVVGLAICILGVAVYVLKPNTITSWTFLLMGLTIGQYGVTGFEIHTSYYLVRFHYFVLSIFPFTFLHLGLIFPERKRLMVRYPILDYLIYVPPLVMGIAYQVYFSTYPEIFRQSVPFYLPTYIGLSTFARIFTLLGFVSFIVLVLHSYFTASIATARLRAKMMLFGVTIAFLPAAVLALLALVVKVYFPYNFVSLFAVFFPMLIAYSIVRHNLFDADVIIRRTVGYTMVTALVIGAYIGVSLLLNVFMGKYEIAQSRVFPILFTLGIILIFNPLRDRIQALVDRLFFRKEYDYGSIVENVGGAMTSLLDRDRILERLMQTFIGDMFIDTGSIMLLAPAGAEYKVCLADGEKKEEIEKKAIHQDHPLTNIIEEEKENSPNTTCLKIPNTR